MDHKFKNYQLTDIADIDSKIFRGAEPDVNHPKKMIFKNAEGGFEEVILAP